MATPRSRSPCASPRRAAGTRTRNHTNMPNASTAPVPAQGTGVVDEDDGARALAPQGRSTVAINVNEMLLAAVAKGELDIVEEMLTNGAVPGARGQFDVTPLHWACSADNAAMASLLLLYGANVNATDAQSRTPLHYACIEDSNDAARALLRHGADVNMRDTGGCTPSQLIYDDDENAELAELVRPTNAPTDVPSAEVVQPSLSTTRRLESDADGSGDRAYSDAGPTTAPSRVDGIVIKLSEDGKLSDEQYEAIKRASATTSR